MNINHKINQSSNHVLNHRKKPILLCILDGWGIDDNSTNNAIRLAHTSNYDKILDDFPHSKIYTSGLDVGLPEGQIGNSEVGHSAIGSGRIILQDLPRINNSINSNSLSGNENLKDFIKLCKINNKTCHLLGLLSDGGVHSHQNHIIELAKIISRNNILVNIHCFLDGRDVAQKSAKLYITNLLQEISSSSNIRIASICGRYFAMDRDKNWDRIHQSFNAIALGKGDKFSDPLFAIDQSYQNNITDEFFLPASHNDFDGIKNGDGLLVANFRADRIRQISESLLDNNFSGFTKQKINFCCATSMTEYSDSLNNYFSILFPTIEIKNSLGEILSDLGFRQLRIAETEKYAHVTFFFSGGKEEKFLGEDRILVKSPAVATYDLLPEMAAKEVGKELSKAISDDKYDFIVVNYANPDMVGHSGILPASIKACEVIDSQIGMLKDLILQKNGIMIITADHGNIENMVDPEGNPHTAHTTNPVPFILIGNDLQKLELKNGKLCDIAPTILQLMNIKKPEEMTGESLIQC